MPRKPKSLNFDVDVAKFTLRQMDAIRALDSGRTKFLLYGGALGGGKSYLLRWYALRRLMDLSKQGYKTPTVMLACEDYTSLKDRQIQKISQEMYQYGEIKSDHALYGRCFILHSEYGGGVMCFRNLDDPSKYQSSEFAAILVDELTKNDYNTFTQLRSRLRWPGLADVQCQFLGATNPGGIGHGWCKQFWMDKIFPVEWCEPIDYRPLFHYIPSKATDNPYLDDAYWAQLQTLPPGLRAAFRDGDWNVFIGQAFPEWGAVHIITDRDIPRDAPLYMSFDWGYGKPFSIAWYYVDSDGRVVMFSEWYGWTGTADVGLRLTDSDIARGIIDREEQLNLQSRSIIRYAGHDSWNKKPDYQGGGQGPSTAETFITGFGLSLHKADPSRTLKLRQFRERLRVPGDGTAPMFQVFESCTQARRTLPDLIMDKHNVEDVDTKGEDHIFDSIAQIFMARPIAMQVDKPRKNYYEKRLDDLCAKPRNTFASSASRELGSIRTWGNRTKVGTVRSEARFTKIRTFPTMKKG